MSEAELAEWGRILRAQRARVLDERAQAIWMGHEVPLPHRDWETGQALYLVCIRCALTYKEPIELPLTLGTLARTYCPRLAVDPTTQRHIYWYWPEAHRTDVPFCRCNGCEQARRGGA